MTQVLQQNDSRLNDVIKKAIEKTEASTKFQLAQILLGFDKQDDKSEARDKILEFCKGETPSLTKDDITGAFDSPERQELFLTLLKFNPQ